MDRLYNTYRGMIYRTERTYPSWNNKHYLEKGIKVCEEWKNDFNAFKNWALSVGYDYNKPRALQTIDRIDNDKDYCPENCRFVSIAENNKNRKVNHFRGIRCVSPEVIKEIIRRAGTTKKINLAKEYGVCERTIYKIIKNA